MTEQGGQPLARTSVACARKILQRGRSWFEQLSDEEPHGAQCLQRSEEAPGSSRFGDREGAALGRGMQRAYA